MKIEFEEGFKIKLVAENQLERLFMIEWERKSAIPIEDQMRMLDRHINPDFIDWRFQEKP